MGGWTTVARIRRKSNKEVGKLKILVPEIVVFIKSW